MYCLVHGKHRGPSSGPGPPAGKKFAIFLTSQREIRAALSHGNVRRSCRIGWAGRGPRILLIVYRLSPLIARHFSWNTGKYLKNSRARGALWVIREKPPPFPGAALLFKTGLPAIPPAVCTRWAGTWRAAYCRPIKARFDGDPLETHPGQSESGPDKLLRAAKQFAAQAPSRLRRGPVGNMLAAIIPPARLSSPPAVCTRWVGTWRAAYCPL